AASRAAPRGLHTDGEVDEWIARQRAAGTLDVQVVPLDALQDWGTEPGSGNLVHRTGRFFSVLGLDVQQRTGLREIPWDQPIIEQPEVGILGVLAKRIGGVLHFCLQAKEEPGNIGAVQLSPTVQATFSNYTRAHRGAEPPFLALFTAPAPESVVFARLQTEDGSRFLHKSNRNMVVLVGDEVPDEVPGPFLWLTLRQIAQLLRRDNLVNACARSVLSALALPLSLPGGRGPAAGPGAGGADIRETLQWLDDIRAGVHLRVKRIGLNELDEWERDVKGYFSHHEGRYFRLVGLRVSSEHREVRRWDQPIIENAARGIIGLLVRHGAGGLECLLQARPEPGNRPAVQVGPTVQFTPGNYCANPKLPRPFLLEEFSQPGRFPLLLETLQAEEGARFFRECHTHRVLMLPPGTELEPPRGYRWVPEAHLRFLLHLGEQVNSCARSIVGCLL
ncbi:MAG TPA: NDP-hexose 2,3-dehydratase family protein, partial [bacterium]